MDKYIEHKQEINNDLQSKLYIITSDTTTNNSTNNNDDSSDNSLDYDTNSTISNSDNNINEQSILPSISYLQQKYTNAADQIKSISSKLLQSESIIKTNSKLQNGNTKGNNKLTDGLIDEQLNKLRKKNESQEKFLARLRLLLYDTNNKLQSLIVKYNNTLLDNEKLNDEIRLITYELINTKSDIIKLKEIIRNNSRINSKIDMQIFQYEDHIGINSKYIDILNTNINNLIYINTMNNHIIEQLIMYTEDLYHKNLISYESINKLNKDYQIILKELQNRKKYNKSDIELLKFNLIQMTTNKNFLENKVKSLSKDLQKQLVSQIPLNHQISKLNKRVTELIIERDFYKEKASNQDQDEDIQIQTMNVDSCNVWSCTNSSSGL